MIHSQMVLPGRYTAHSIWRLAIRNNAGKYFLAGEDTAMTNIQTKATWELQNTVNALKPMKIFNTDEQNARLAECEKELRRRTREARQAAIDAKLAQYGVKGIRK